MPNYKKYHNGNGSTPSGEYQAGLHSSSRAKGTIGQGEDEINLKRLFFAAWRRRWHILSFVIFFGLLAGIIAFLTTPIYQSYGSILIYQPQSELSTLGLGGGALGNSLSSNFGIGGGTAVDNQLEVLRSRKLSLDIADSLLNKRIMPNGRQYPIIFRGFPDDSMKTSRDTVAIRLRNKLTFNKVGNNTDVIGVFYESPSPVAAGQVVNIALSQFNKLSNRQNRTSANSAASFLDEERSRIRDSLKTAEENLRVFMNHHKLIQIDAQTQGLIQQMANLEASRQEARAKLVAANSGIKQYKNQLNAIKPGLAEQYSEAVGSDIKKLQYVKSEQEVRKQQLLANNPNLKDSSHQIAKINQQITYYKNKIKSLTQGLLNHNDQYLGFLGDGGGIAQSVSNMNQELIELQVKQKQYQSQIDVTSSQLKIQENFFNNLPDNIIAFAKLKRNVKIDEELYETVSKQYAQTSIQERSQFGLGRVIDNGYTPLKPEKPNKPLYILLGLILGGVLSIGYIFVKIAFFTTIQGVEKMKNLSTSLLSVIPVMDVYIKNYYKDASTIEFQGNTISTKLMTLFDPDSVISESFRRLGVNIVYAQGGRTAKSIVVTSSSEGEGKTTTIANLGISLAEDGHNTIIVDADFRHPDLHHMFGLSDRPGIIEVLSDNINLDDAIQCTSAPGLSLLSAGNHPSNTGAFTKSKSFTELLKKLESRFDFILIDTSPFGSVSDSAPILKQTEGVIVAVKFGETTDDEFNQTIEKLHQLDTTILGTVLTAYNYNKSDDAHPAYSFYKKGKNTSKNVYQ